MNWIFAYYQAIRDGTELVGEWTRLIYEYLVKGLESGLFFYDQKKANGAINWLESHCFHVKGPLAPNPLRFELWQKALISAIFGIVDENGKRQFWEVLLVIGRKDGKSILGSGIADYVFREIGGYGSEVYCVAPKLDQAGIIYDTTWQMILLDPEYQELAEYCNERDCRGVKVHDQSMLPKKRRSDLSIAGTNAVMKKIAFAAKTADGWNPSLCLCDEIAAWPGDKGKKMYEVMKSGMGARAGDALLISMTTSGYENEGIYDELMKRSTRFLLGDSNEKHLLPVIYMIDDVDKWNDINELHKSMPMLGKSISIDYILNEISVAEQSLSKKSEFLCKYCCVKQNSSAAWMRTQDIEKNFSGNPLKLEDFRECYGVGGIDLSQTTDLTAAILIIEKNGKQNVFAHFWMPSEKVEEATARDGVPYRAFIKRGFLSTSGEGFVNYQDVEKWFTDLVEEYRIYPLKVGFDRYSAQYLVQDLSAYGFNMDDVFQGENLTPVINEVDGLIREGRFECGDNDLLKIHLLNAALKQNNETNRKRLVKIAQTQRIDGVAAFLDAMCVRQKWFAEIGEQLKNGD
ncbi:MAG: terminase large subunit [Clostridia bacterium]|nr:terminase large subunit [Clostridia bacterium]